MRTPWPDNLDRFLTPQTSRGGYQLEEMIAWQYYDFYTDAKAAEFTCFRRSEDRYDLQKTNMDMPGVLPIGKRFGVTSFDFKVGYHSPGGRMIGSCPKCGAPLSADPNCLWCNSMLPPLSSFDGSIHGNFEFQILNKLYSSGKINGPVASFSYSIPFPIPSQCCFSVRVKFNRKVERLNVVMNGYLIRALQ